MTGAHWHLLLNHIPVLAVPAGLGLLLGSLSRLDVSLQRAAFVLLVIAGISGGLAYLTGEPAEDALKDLAVQLDDRVGPHEDAALFGLLTTAGLGLLAAAGLWRTRRGPLGRTPVLAVSAFTLLTAVTLARVAYLGGKIRHTEIDAGPGALTGSRKGGEQ